MSTGLIRIVAVVVDTKLLTLYKEDGKTIEINQGDPRVQTVLAAMPQIEQHGYADIQIGADNPYKDFEEKSGGLVRFFRVAKKKVSSIFGGATEEAAPVAPVGAVGRIPKDNDAVIAPTPSGPAVSSMPAVDEVMRHATPASAPEFDPDVSNQDDTIIAVVGDKIIPHAEQLKDHVRHSAKVLSSTTGMENFFKRISPIIEKRGHSVEDLLRFMEKNDLPIADDGSLIVYKVLRKNKDGTYRDCHTGNVPQRIGSLVCVDETLVDKNRRNECSNGLHVARRGYIGGFGGDCCTLVKVAPEDVITVPHGDPNKVRVCGYHIIMELERDAWQKLQRNVPMTDNPKAQRMLGRAMSGDHIGVIETVQIGGQRGTKISITPAPKGGMKAIARNVPPPAPAVALDDESVAQRPENQPVDEAANAAAMTKVIKSSAQKASPEAQLNATGSVRVLTRNEQARELMDIIYGGMTAEATRKAAIELLALKRKSKVSWDSLGIREDEAKKALAEAARPVPTPVTTVDKAAPNGDFTAKVVSKFEKGQQKIVDVKVTKPQRPDGPSRRERIASLAVALRSGQTAAVRVQAARDLLEIRRKAKQSWEALDHPDFTDEALKTFVNTDGKGGPLGTPDAPKPAPLPAKKVATVNKTAPKPAAPKSEAQAPSREDRARALFNAKNWKALWQLKRSAKKGWANLGFTEAETAIITSNKS